MDKVRFGIIGLGNMGSTHVHNFLSGNIKNAVITAVCDIKENRLQWAKSVLGESVAYFNNAADLMESGKVDAILVAVPHYLHPSMAIEALNNNLNVLVEKPAGVYTKQVEEMNEVARKSDKVFGIMFNQRTNPIYQKAKELVSSGEIGNIKRTNWIITDWYRTQAYYDSGDWRATWAGEGGGVLLNQAPHNLDLWQWICGMPKKVRAICNEAKFHDIEVEDDVTAYVEYENGATGVFITSTGDFPGSNRFEIIGDKGKILIEHGQLQFWKLRESERKFCQESQDGFGSPEVWKCEVPIHGRETSHIGIVNDFVDSILNGTPLLASGLEGINGVELANAMYLSSWLDSVVELPIDSELYYEKLQGKINNSTFKKKVTEQSFDLEGTY